MVQHLSRQRTLCRACAGMIQQVAACLVGIDCSDLHSEQNSGWPLDQRLQPEAMWCQLHFRPRLYRCISEQFSPSDTFINMVLGYGIPPVSSVGSLSQYNTLPRHNTMGFHSEPTASQLPWNSSLHYRLWHTRWLGEVGRAGTPDSFLEFYSRSRASCLHSMKAEFATQDRLRQNLAWHQGKQGTRRHLSVSLPWLHQTNITGRSLCRLGGYRDGEQACENPIVFDMEGHLWMPADHVWPVCLISLAWKLKTRACPGKAQSQRHLYPRGPSCQLHQM